MAYAELLPGERTSIHSAYATALTRHPELAGAQSEHAAQLAQDWYAAHALDQALGAAVEAGRLAERRYGFKEAQFYFERALELWEKAGDATGCAGLARSALLQQAARAAALAGNHRRAASLRRIAVRGAEEAGDQMHSGQLLERLGRCLWSAGSSEEALAAYEEALRRIPSDPITTERVRALAARGEALTLTARHREAAACCRGTIEMAVALGARVEEVRARRNLGMALVFLGEGDEGVSSLRDALRIAEDIWASPRWPDGWL